MGTLKSIDSVKINSGSMKWKNFYEEEAKFKRYEAGKPYVVSLTSKIRFNSLLDVECGESKVLLEAQACSCPVVATDMGSNPEIINEKGGLLCEPRSSSDLARKITEVLENKERYDGSEFVKDFAWERNVEEMIKLYEQINSYFLGLG